MKKLSKVREGCKVLACCMVMSALSGCGVMNFQEATSDATGTVETNEGEAYKTESCTEEMATGVQYDEDSYVLDSYNTEEYSTFVENRFLSVQDAPVSTFSADVDTASYANIRRMILDGYLPTKDAVRVEEMMNYFDYEYQAPSEDAPIGIHTELTDCPWNQESQLLSIAINTEEVHMEDLPPSNLVFLIDTSGSMESINKLPLVQEAFSLLVDELKDGDRISIVTYAGSTDIVLEGATYEKKQAVLDGIHELYASGSTYGSDAILMAYELAEEYFIEEGNNRIILATDGDLNVGLTSESELKSLVENQRDKGIYLSVLGFGDGNYKDNKMETLSQNGNGNYYYIDSKIEAEKVLVQEMGATLHTIAKDVKLQVEFNPAMIQGYRLIGYENRVLETQDFTDDKKDAGEIGAGHQVTALYELVMADAKQAVNGTELKYQEQVLVDSDELLTISVRYKEPNEDVSKEINKVVTRELHTDEMSNNMMLASAVAEFGMLLRDSESKGSASYEAVLERIRDTRAFVEDDYVAELYTLVKHASVLDK